MEKWTLILQTLYHGYVEIVLLSLILRDEIVQFRDYSRIVNYEIGLWSELSWPCIDHVVVLTIFLQLFIQLYTYLANFYSCTTEISTESYLWRFKTFLIPFWISWLEYKGLGLSLGLRLGLGIGLRLFATFDKEYTTRTHKNKNGENSNEYVRCRGHLYSLPLPNFILSIERGGKNN